MNAPDKSPDKSLRDNSKPFQVLFELFYEETYRSAYMITRNHQQAEDATQEAFLKAFTHLDTLEEPKKFGAWIRAIAVRSAIDLLRREQRLVFTEEADVQSQGQPLFTVNFPLPQEEVERRELRSRVRDAIASLAPAQQVVVVLKFFHGYQDLEIADLLHVSAGTVKSRAHRALQTIARKLKPYLKSDATAFVSPKRAKGGRGHGRSAQ